MITYFDILPSTNLYLKEMADSYDNLDAITTHHQTEGRGRMDRTWVDEDDLLMSILVKDDVKDPEKLSLLICATIFKTLNKYLSSLKVKWPNDILCNNKKICGILLEGKSDGEKNIIVVGFGVNVNSTKFSGELKQKATSMKLELGKDFDINKLSKEIYQEFINDYNHFINGDEDYLKICKDNSCLIGKEVNIYYNDSIVKAKVIDILDNGHILLEIDGERLEKSSGEVTLHMNY